MRSGLAHRQPVCNCRAVPKFMPFMVPPPWDQMLLTDLSYVKFSSTCQHDCQFLAALWYKLTKQLLISDKGLLSGQWSWGKRQESWAVYLLISLWMGHCRALHVHQASSKLEMWINWFNKALKKKIGAVSPSGLLSPNITFLKDTKEKLGLPIDGICFNSGKSKPFHIFRLCYLWAYSLFHYKSAKALSVR